MGIKPPSSNYETQSNKFNTVLNSSNKLQHVKSHNNILMRDHNTDNNNIINNNNERPLIKSKSNYFDTNRTINIMGSHNHVVITSNRTIVTKPTRYRVVP